MTKKDKETLEEHIVAENELLREDLWEDGELNKQQAMKKLRNLYLQRSISFKTFNYYLEEVSCDYQRN
jgi:hypothetical protein